MTSAWPLVGRDEELRVIARAVEGVDGAPGLVLAGSAGVGKTRLVREALEGALARGARVYRASATASGTGVPLGAFADVCRHLGPDPLRRVHEVIDAIVEPTRPGAVVVAIDDAHRLDALSAFVVRQLVVGAKARVLLTVRTGQPSPDAITALWKDQLLPRLDLEPITDAELRALLEEVLAGPMESDSARRMWSLTRGNALYASELVESELAAHRLRRSAGVWLWDGPGTLSPSLRELLVARIGTLPESIGDVVDIVALGEPVELAVLSRVSGADAIEAAEVQGLISVDAAEDGSRLARLTHPLFGEVRRSEVASMRGRRLRRLLADELARAGHDDAHGLVRRAELSLDADPPPDPSLLAGAAHAAVRLLDPESAEHQVLRAKALMMRGQGAEAEEVLAALATDGDADRVPVSTLRAANLVWMLGEVTTANAILADAVAVAPAEADMVAAIRTSVAAAQAHPRAAIARAQTVIGFRRLPDLHATMALGALILSNGALGRLSAASEAASQGYALTAASDEAAQFRFWIGALHARALRLAGRIDEVTADAERLRAAAADAPGPARSETALLMGHAHLCRGRLADAIRWLRESRATATSQGNTSGMRVGCLAWLTEALAMTGAADEAGATLAELDAIRYPEFAFMDTAVEIARAWTTAAAGPISEARSIARTAADVARARGQSANEVICLQVATQFGDGGTAARLGELARLVDGPRAPAAATHAIALAANDGAGLAAASRAYASMGDQVAGGDAAAQAAIAYRDTQHRGPALAAAARARHLADLCQGATTPAMREASAPAPLTGRQREVVMLAARGMSNREIAERLFVSVRTVEGHLYRASQRTGAPGRDRLGEIL